MRFTPSVLAAHQGSFRQLKTPGVASPESQRDPAVIETVTGMLRDIEKRGMDAVLDYAVRLDHWDRDRDLELTADQIKSSESRLPADLREAIELGSERTKAFSRAQMTHLDDFETELTPGLVTGVKYVPVSRVGAYLPAGRFPLTASAFMTVGVAKTAGVPTVVACTAPQPNGLSNDAVVHA